MHLHYIYKFVYQLKPVSKPFIVKANLAPINQVCLKKQAHIFICFLFPLHKDISMIQYNQALNLVKVLV